MSRLLAAGFLALCAACSSARYTPETGAPSVTLPASFAEGNTGKDGGAPVPPQNTTTEVARSTGDGGAPSAGGTLPDPPPLVTRDQWELLLEYDRGAVKVARVRAVTTPRPTATPRHVGRFAIELWIGRELVDRVRFDFPMLAADTPDPKDRRPLHPEARFGPGARTSRTVMVPASDRATSARLVDRLSGQSTPLEWPPVPPSAAAPGTQ